MDSDPLNPAQWIPLDEAAKLLSRDAGSLRRICRDELASRGMARLEKDGGREKWHISPAYDPKLIGGAIGPQYQFPDLLKFTKRQREGTLMRLDCVERFTEHLANDNRPVNVWIPELVATLRSEHPTLRISRSHLYEWHKRYKRPADLVKLIDRRRYERNVASPEAVTTFRGFYLHQNRPSLKQCWREVKRMAVENGWKWVSLTACYQWLDRWIPPEEQAFNREPDVWRKQLQPTIEQDPRDGRRINAG